MWTKKKRKKLVNTLHEGGEHNRSASQTSNAVEFSAEDVLDTVMGSLEDAKAEDIKQINITGKSALGDYMVIASGRSHRHVGAITDQILRELKAAGYGSARVEGQQAADWVLIDTGDVIIHIFRPEVRDFYGIEKMWSIPGQAEHH